MTVKDIAKTIEDFAPLALQESYDNAGLQVGDPEMQVSSALLCLDVTEEILEEARQRECNLIVSHHPLIFRGLKHLTGSTPTERIVMKALTSGIAIYSAHTNLDSTFEGVSYEIANSLGMTGLRPLRQAGDNPRTGLGVVGTVKPTPRLEFLRRVKETFGVRDLRYSSQDSRIVVRTVAVCGGSGGSLIDDAIRAGADVYVTGDLRYHDFTSYGDAMILADIGHYESELCSQKIFSRVIRGKYPDFATYFAESESNPIKIL
ncbi:MAG: Nif3-like dinuclear metal center hexameric protein [Muribaculaceae bacterium]|nr:Nif3-like dinuclear metal center hexameric protein [Muribaculaceae bacterium]